MSNGPEPIQNTIYVVSAFLIAWNGIHRCVSGGATQLIYYQGPISSCYTLSKLSSKKRKQILTLPVAACQQLSNMHWNSGLQRGSQQDKKLNGGVVCLFSTITLSRAFQCAKNGRASSRVSLMQCGKSNIIRYRMRNLQLTTTTTSTGKLFWVVFCTRDAEKQYCQKRK